MDLNLIGSLESNLSCILDDIERGCGSSQAAVKAWSTKKKEVDKVCSINLENIFCYINCPESEKRSHRLGKKNSFQNMNLIREYHPKYTIFLKDN